MTKKIFRMCQQTKFYITNFVAVYCTKKVLRLNKPIYVGFCVLELNKLKMYHFHYDWALKTFKDVKLLFTDTDSLVYEIKGVNVYDTCFKDSNLFDFSRYPKDSKYYCNINKKSCRKDEKRT